MGTDFWSSLRLNLLIVIIFPVAVLGVTKAVNAFLPQRYYFSISSIVKGSDEPFIVPTPAVTGLRLCELLRRYGIDPHNSYGQIEKYVNCNEEYADKDDGRHRFKQDNIKLSRAVKDTLYRRAFQTDREALKKLNYDVGLSVKPLSGAELSQLVDGSASIQSAFRRINGYYTKSVNTIDQGLMHSYINSSFTNVIPFESAAINAREETQYNDAPLDVRSAMLTAHETASIKAAHASFIKAFASVDFSTYDGINASDLDNILFTSADRVQVQSGIYNFYKGKATATLEQHLRRSFLDEGLEVLESGTERNAVVREIYWAEWPSYLLATTIRLMPVFVLAILFGIVVGRREVASLTFAAGLAAFLLVWPVVLLWDNVVNSKWYDDKWKFLLLYAAYIVTYGAVGRTGSLIGCYMRTKLGWPDEPSAEATKYERDISVNLVASIIFAILTAAYNLIIPLKA